MLRGIVRHIPKQRVHIACHNGIILRSITMSHPRFGKSEDSSWSDTSSFKEEPFPQSLTEYRGVDAVGEHSVSSASEGIVASTEGAGAMLRELDMMHPFDMVCSYINNIHVACDVPYWGAIMMGTVTLRVFILPIAIRIMQNGGRLAVVQPLVKAKVDEAQRHKDDKELHSKLMLEAAGIYKEHNVNPLLSVMLPFVQMPLFVSFFFGLQRMGEVYPDYNTGGTLWFENLTAIDPTYMLPLLNGLTFFLVFETNPDLKNRQPQMMIFFRAMALLMVPITANFQSVREMSLDGGG